MYHLILLMLKFESRLQLLSHNHSSIFNQVIWGGVIGWGGLWLIICAKKFYLTRVTFHNKAGAQTGFDHLFVSVIFEQVVKLEGCQ